MYMYWWLYVWRYSSLQIPTYTNLGWLLEFVDWACSRSTRETSLLRLDPIRCIMALGRCIMEAGRCSSSTRLACKQSAEAVRYDKYKVSHNSRSGDIPQQGIWNRRQFYKIFRKKSNLCDSYVCIIKQGYWCGNRHCSFAKNIMATF